MNVHNLMEEIVKKSVDNLYENAKSEKLDWLTCDCANCRLDTVSYVLNRISPKYVVSGRGAAHATRDLENNQLQADIEAIALEGMKTVNSTKRPYHLDSFDKQSDDKPSTPYFNFCTFSGRVLDGATFEPVPNATVTFKFQGKIAEMFDSTWSNPYITMDVTQGYFSFLLKPIKTKKANEVKSFCFSIEISAQDYEGIQYHFELPIFSENGKRTNFDSTFTYRLNDFVIFKK